MYPITDRDHHYYMVGQRGYAYRQTDQACSTYMIEFIRHLCCNQANYSGGMSIACMIELRRRLGIGDDAADAIYKERQSPDQYRWYL